MSDVKDLLLATNNSKKIKEIREILGNSYEGAIFCAADFPDLTEPEETGSTFEENALIKADYYASSTGLTSLADDSGLVVDALDGRPGVHSARYAATDELRIARLLDELEGTPEPARTARFICAMCMVTPEGEQIMEKGILEGRIGFTKKGQFGFGYDPIFLVGSGDKSLAELSPEDKNSISHRGQAMKKIHSALLNALTSG